VVCAGCLGLVGGGKSGGFGMEDAFQATTSSCLRHVPSQLGRVCLVIPTWVGMGQYIHIYRHMYGMHTVKV
jgi:hypothetical protein